MALFSLREVNETKSNPPRSEGNPHKSSHPKQDHPSNGGAKVEAAGGEGNVGNGDSGSKGSASGRSNGGGGSESRNGDGNGSGNGNGDDDDDDGNGGRDVDGDDDDDDDGNGGGDGGGDDDDGNGGGDGGGDDDDDDDDDGNGGGDGGGDDDDDDDGNGGGDGGGDDDDDDGDGDVNSLSNDGADGTGDSGMTTTSPSSVSAVNRNYSQSSSRTRMGIVMGTAALVAAMVLAAVRLRHAPRSAATDDAQHPLKSVVKRRMSIFSHLAEHHPNRPARSAVVIPEPETSTGPTESKYQLYDEEGNLEVTGGST